MVVLEESPFNNSGQKKRRRGSFGVMAYALMISMHKEPMI